MLKKQDVGVDNFYKVQSSIFSTGGKFCSDYRLLLELHVLTLVARSYVLLIKEYLQIVVEKLLPFVKLGYSCRKPLIPSKLLAIAIALELSLLVMISSVNID